jgi:hypothetical protein
VLRKVLESELFNIRPKIINNIRPIITKWERLFFI